MSYFVYLIGNYKNKKLTTYAGYTNKSGNAWKNKNWLANKNFSQRFEIYIGLCATKAWDKDRKRLSVPWCPRVIILYVV